MKQIINIFIVGLILAKGLMVSAQSNHIYKDTV